MALEEVPIGPIGIASASEEWRRSVDLERPLADRIRALTEA